MSITRTVATASTAARDDASLVRLAQQGDLTAFDALVRPRLPRTIRTACAILGNEADAEDATQEAFIAAWRQLPSLRDPERLDAWLSRIVINACRMRLRNRRRVREISVDHDVAARDLPWPETIDRTGEVELVSRAFDTLSGDDRSLLVLHHLDHERVATIASALGIPAGTVKWRLSRARRALARAMEAGR